MMNDDEMMKLVEECGEAILDIINGIEFSGDDITSFWATLIGNISSMIYDTNPKAVPWAACYLTAGKLNLVAEKLREEYEHERRTKGEEL